MSEAVVHDELGRAFGGLRDATIGLVIGLAALAVLFHTEIITAAKTWIDSTAYNHCFLVVPIALYLIWAGGIERLYLAAALSVAIYGAFFTDRKSVV